MSPGVFISTTNAYEVRVNGALVTTIPVPCCEHGNDPQTCSDCPSVGMTPRDFFALYNCVWAMTYAFSHMDSGQHSEVPVRWLKACHDEMAEIVLRYADTFPDFHKAHLRHSR